MIRIGSMRSERMAGWFMALTLCGSCTSTPDATTEPSANASSSVSTDAPPPDEVESATVRQRNLLRDGVDAWTRGDRDAAIDALTALGRTQTPSRERVDGIRLLGEIQYSTGDVDGAIATLLELRASAPPDARVEYVLGRALLAAGLLVEAEDALRRSVRIDPARIRGYVALQALLADVGRIEDAEAVVVSLERELYRMAGQLDGDTPPARRLAIVEALGDGVVDPRVARTLTRALDDPQQDVRAAACDALARVGDTSILQHLQYVEQHDEDDSVRARSRAATDAIRARSSHP